ncbi:MAG: hypothetical protein D6786_06310 [Gammaproteobacteria bacterium]|nr:MAG: hypothetical protein D6786_06310 [Gammaproteobacteria bacterium]
MTPRRARAAGRDLEMRQRIAEEAARLIATEGLRDYGLAKRKAAQRLRAPETRNLPANREIEAALVRYQALFQAERHAATLQRLRRIALEAMRFFAPFSPRLTGSVLSGTASEYSDVNLHLFAETPEEVVFHMQQHGLPYTEDQRRFRFERNGPQRPYPVLRFVVSDTPVEAVIFPVDGIRQAPRSARDGRPMDRASLARLTRLMEPAGEEGGTPS